jgi:glycine cleavage system H protein
LARFLRIVESERKKNESQIPKEKEVVIMVIILVALTIIVALSAQAISRYYARKREVISLELAREYGTVSPAVAVPVLGRVPQFPEDFYYHNGHAWMKFEEGNKIRVGLDDFTQQVMGNFDKIEIPLPDGELKQGEVAWKVSNGNRKLSQLAPLGGTVVEVNEKLRRDPTLANRSPYEEGWILKIQAKALNKEMSELMDAFQFKGYFDQCKARLMSSFNNQTLGLAYGDGEEVIQGASSKLDERTWKMLVTQLFHSSTE